MAITSLLFLAFFAAVALINYALPRVLRPYFLLAASYGFFCYDPVNRPLVWVIAAATVLTWLCGLIIGKVRAKPVRVLALAASWGSASASLSTTNTGPAGRHGGRQHPLPPGESAGPAGVELLHVCGDELHHRRLQAPLPGRDKPAALRAVCQLLPHPHQRAH